MNVFILTFKIILPISMAGFSSENKAFVNCYAPSDDFQQAFTQCEFKLETDGYQIEELLKTAHQMESKDWLVHIQDQYPEYVDKLYTQAEFDSFMLQKKVVLSPFACY